MKKKKAGRPTKPAKDKAVKVLVTLPPDVADRLRAESKITTVPASQIVANALALYWSNIS